MAALDFTFERREKLIQRDSFEEGLAKGEARGKTEKLISLVCRKLKKRKTAEVIAEELEEETALVEAICEAAKSFAPEYDVKKIYEALQSKAGE